MGITREIAEFVCDTKYRDFDSSVNKYTKDLLLSGLGMTLAGSTIRAGRVAINYVRDCGAPAEAGVVGAGFRTSAEYAALANGTTSHATELEDDSYPEAVYTVGIFPTSFALAEKLQLNGKSVIEATIIGYEVMAQLSLACLEALNRGFQNACAFGSLGAAAAAAKLLKLGVQETTMALSLAASQSCGLMWQQGTGAHLFEAGVCGRNGIAAAILAKKGLDGQTDILEAHLGLCFALSGVREPKVRLGEFRIRKVGVKKYPCCFMMMHIIEGFIELIRKNTIHAEDVESILVDVNPGFVREVRYHHPANRDNAAFSLPHSIATCFLEDKISLDSYTDEKVQDPRFHELREKVEIVVHPEWERPGTTAGEVPIAIKLKNGRVYKKSCPSADSPIAITDKDIMDKYMDCALRVLSQKQAEDVARMTLALEDVKDISELMTILTFPKK